jgi:hypothetical protein
MIFLLKRFVCVVLWFALHCEVIKTIQVTKNVWFFFLNEFSHSIALWSNKYEINHQNVWFYLWYEFFAFHYTKSQWIWIPNLKLDDFAYDMNFSQTIAIWGKKKTWNEIIKIDNYTYDVNFSHSKSVQ